MTKIISGGQTGADYGGLLAARELGWPTGGFAPKGWRVDPQDARYPGGANPQLKEFGLQEHSKSSYVFRTMLNVDRADLTIAFMLRGIPSVGTSKTLGYCQFKEWKDYDPNYMGPLHRNYLLIDDVSRPKRGEAAHTITQYLEGLQPDVVNIAGHRQMSITRWAKAHHVQSPDFEQIVKDILIAGFLGLQP